MSGKLGGNKTKKNKTKSSYNDNNKHTPFSNHEGQEYAVVLKMLGNRRLTIKCSDYKERLGIIPGKFKGKKYWIQPGMLLLVNIRDYQDDKADVIYVYNPTEVLFLQKANELSFMNIKDETDFDFDEDNDDVNNNLQSDDLFNNL